MNINFHFELSPTDFCYVLVYSTLSQNLKGKDFPPPKKKEKKKERN